MSSCSHSRAEIQRNIFSKASERLRKLDMDIESAVNH